VFPRHRAVVLVNGCFWHGHDCHLFKWPRSDGAFWEKKIAGNKRRDQSVQQQLATEGWRSLTVWECSLRRADATRVEAVAKGVAQWLATGSPKVSPLNNR